MHFDGEVNLVGCVRRCVGRDRDLDTGGIGFAAGIARSALPFNTQEGELVSTRDRCLPGEAAFPLVVLVPENGPQHDALDGRLLEREQQLCEGDSYSGEWGCCG